MVLGEKIIYTPQVRLTEGPFCLNAYMTYITLNTQLT